MPTPIIVRDEVAEKYAELVADARKLLDMHLDPTTTMELLRKLVARASDLSPARALDLVAAIRPISEPQDRTRGTSRCYRASEEPRPPGD
jgi:hypothetical protein